MTGVRMYLTLTLDSVSKLAEMEKIEGTGMPILVEMSIRKFYEAWKETHR